MLWKTMKQRKTVKINNSICYLLILYKILDIGEGKVCTNNFNFFFSSYKNAAGSIIYATKLKN